MQHSILVVDESAAMQAFIRRTLAISGYAMQTCYSASGVELALQTLRRRKVDLVLSDVKLRDRSGEELLLTVVNDEALRGTPVVMLSNDGTRYCEDRLLGMGARGFIAKPFSPESLRFQLERILRPREPRVDQHLYQVVEKILGHMFFAPVLGPAPEPGDPKGWTAVVDFAGTRRGKLGVWVDGPLARELSANFLGSHGVVPARLVAGIIAELAGMICGSLMAKLEPQGRFSFATPLVTLAGIESGVLESMLLRQTFQLDAGRLVAGLKWNPEVPGR